MQSTQFLREFWRTWKEVWTSQFLHITPRTTNDLDLCWKKAAINRLHELLRLGIKLITKNSILRISPCFWITWFFYRSYVECIAKITYYSVAFFVETCSENLNISLSTTVLVMLFANELFHCIITLAIRRFKVKLTSVTTLSSPFITYIIVITVSAGFSAVSAVKSVFTFWNIK